MPSLWPRQILTKCLQEVEDLEVRLQLATEVQVFDVGIEVGLFLVDCSFLYSRSSSDEVSHTLLPIFSPEL